MKQYYLVELKRYNDDDMLLSVLDIDTEHYYDLKWHSDKDVFVFENVERQDGLNQALEFLIGRNIDNKVFLFDTNKLSLDLKRSFVEAINKH